MARGDAITEAQKVLAKPAERTTSEDIQRLRDVFDVKQPQPGLGSVRGRAFHRVAQLHLRQTDVSRIVVINRAIAALESAEEQFACYDDDVGRHSIAGRLMLQWRDRAAVHSLHFHLLLSGKGRDAAEAYLRRLDIPGRTHVQVLVASFLSALEIPVPEYKENVKSPAVLTKPVVAMIPAQAKPIVLPNVVVQDEEA
jgi:hypothetical protein